MFTKALRGVGMAWQAVGAGAFVLATFFLAVKVPYERLHEQPTFWAQEDLDDGPHFFWSEDGSARVATVHGDRGRREFTVEERRLTGPPR
jgi:hypothetical protein